mmetsp:Transcript_21351/g.50542  ORF Transcript_21351/g.50542 Transcript_21351/m.50542 type:complete len:403 (-) Transcript_21351:138-1346(-)
MDLCENPVLRRWWNRPRLCFGNTVRRCRAGSGDECARGHDWLVGGICLGQGRHPGPRKGHRNRGGKSFAPGTRKGGGRRRTQGGVDLPVGTGPAHSAWNVQLRVRDHQRALRGLCRWDFSGVSQALLSGQLPGILWKVDGRRDGERGRPAGLRVDRGPRFQRADRRVCLPAGLGNLGCHSEGTGGRGPGTKAERAGGERRKGRQQRRGRRRRDRGVWLRAAHVGRGIPVRPPGRRRAHEHPGSAGIRRQGLELHGGFVVVRSRALQEQSSRPQKPGAPSDQPRDDGQVRGGRLWCHDVRRSGVESRFVFVLPQVPGSALRRRGLSAGTGRGSRRQGLGGIEFRTVRCSDVLRVFGCGPERGPGHCCGSSSFGGGGNRVRRKQRAFRPVPGRRLPESIAGSKG